MYANFSSYLLNISTKLLLFFFFSFYRMKFALLKDVTWKHCFVFFADDHSFSLSCRCGGKYCVSKDEAEQVNLISCDTCSLIVELLHS